MHHRMDVGPGVIDGDVHRHFRRRFTHALDLVAGGIAHDEILGTHPSFTNTGRRGQDALALQANGQVAVVRCDPSALVHRTSGSDDVLAELLLAVRHKPSSLPSMRQWWL